MVVINAKRKVQARRPKEAWRDTIPGVHFATTDEGRAIFDYQVRKELNISGEEFLARWDVGEYRTIADPITARKIERLAMLIPFARRTSA